eukprot:m.63582 g.63582  ORF g.63582 m.63582 type:complete len:601 (+) comp11958_c0_seq2:396-2198(+)
MAHALCIYTRGGKVRLAKSRKALRVRLEAIRKLHADYEAGSLVSTQVTALLAALVNSTLSPLPTVQNAALTVLRDISNVSYNRQLADDGLFEALTKVIERTVESSASLQALLLALDILGDGTALSSNLVVVDVIHSGFFDALLLHMADLEDKALLTSALIVKSLVHDPECRVLITECDEQVILLLAYAVQLKGLRVQEAILAAIALLSSTSRSAARSVFQARTANAFPLFLAIRRLAAQDTTYNDKAYAQRCLSHIACIIANSCVLNLRIHLRYSHLNAIMRLLSIPSATDETIEHVVRGFYNLCFSSQPHKDLVHDLCDASVLFVRQLPSTLSFGIREGIVEALNILVTYDAAALYGALSEDDMALLMDVCLDNTQHRLQALSQRLVRELRAGALTKMVSSKAKPKTLERKEQRRPQGRSESGSLTQSIDADNVVSGSDGVGDKDSQSDSDDVDGEDEPEWLRSSSSTDTVTAALSSSAAEDGEAVFDLALMTPLLAEPSEYIDAMTETLHTDVGSAHNASRVSPFDNTTKSCFILRTHTLSFVGPWQLTCSLTQFIHPITYARTHSLSVCLLFKLTWSDTYFRHQSATGTHMLLLWTV